MKIWDRQEKIYFEEIEYEKEKLEFLYNTLFGRILLKCLIARPIFSKIGARYYKSSLSKKEIVPFIKKHHIKIKKSELKKFKSFNDFFTRKEKVKEESEESNVLVAPCSSRLQVYDIEDSLKIKNGTYDIKDIINKEIEIRNGKILIFRLAVDDYHRFIFIDNGRIKERYKIKGVLHTVRPISEKYKVYAKNFRVVNILETENFGEIIEVDVGALLIGHIVERKVKRFKRLDEKGYFEYGGSTIIMIVNEDIEIDKDILEQSKLGYETKVNIGEKIGRIRG